MSRSALEKPSFLKVALIPLLKAKLFILNLVELPHVGKFEMGYAYKSEPRMHVCPNGPHHGQLQGLLAGILLSSAVRWVISPTHANGRYTNAVLIICY